MTSVVGILCTDGIVIGTDSSATFAASTTPTIEQKTNKIEIIDEKIIVAGTGQVGIGQRFCDIVKIASKEHVFDKTPIGVGKELSSRGIKDFQYTFIQPGQYGALVAYVSKGSFHLCEFAVTNFQPELKTKESKLWFVSMGCGQFITDPFLGFMRRVFFKDRLPTVADAIFITTWTLQHVIELNVGGINGPIQMAAIKDKSKDQFVASIITEADLSEHCGNVRAAETYLAGYKDILSGSESKEKIPELKLKETT